MTNNNPLDPRYKILVCEVCGIDVMQGTRVHTRKCPKCGNTARKTLNFEQYKSYLTGRALEALRAIFLVEVHDINWNLNTLKELEGEAKFWKEALENKAKKAQVESLQSKVHGVTGV